jgi:hypothetical protein
MFSAQPKGGDGLERLCHINLNTQKTSRIVTIRDVAIGRDNEIIKANNLYRRITLCPR